jgi:hypothetical protein
MQKVNIPEYLALICHALDTSKYFPLTVHCGGLMVNKMTLELILSEYFGFT